VAGQPGKLLRLYVNEHDQYAGKPLCEAIVDRCRELQAAGVTVFRALEGFGESAELHHGHVFRGDQPVVITIVDAPERARRILPVLESMMSGGVVAIADVEVTFVSKGVRSSLDTNSAK
jgi:uncharacterized protein